MKEFLKKESEEEKNKWSRRGIWRADQCLQDIKDRMAEFDELREGEERKQKKREGCKLKKCEGSKPKSCPRPKREKPAQKTQMSTTKFHQIKKGKSTSMVDVVKETMRV
ncbi:hypothetical protein OS493_002083 [Desmophyllum pertusum]|uniref:Uncharacterized protein n=1 Tax=Desmophyllum pertusum TaxID=174260 RepID=A0A9W9Z555_9CNID|nr:hypothetical protein OS493_002083 [Desmophyllum pertusum]